MIGKGDIKKVFWLWILSRPGKSYVTNYLSDRDGAICAILNIEIVATLFTRRSYFIQGKLSHLQNVFDSLRKKFF
jgi:hypothetical protein